MTTEREQLELPLPRRRHAGWGGARKGAGRKKSKGSGVSHLRRPALSRHHPVHVTLRVRPDVYNLRSRRGFSPIFDALKAALGVRDARFVHYSVQGNHLHMIVEAADRVRLWRRMQGFAIRVARGLNAMMHRRGRVFADRYHAHVLRTPREVRNALRYVLRNSVRHYGHDRRFADPYSSAAWFSGWSSPLRCTWLPFRGDPPTGPPTSWLLQTGWKREGPLEP